VREASELVAAWGRVLDVTATDLAAFQARGGKLIIFHGWSDSNAPPGVTLLERVQIDGF
jgi:hypothetical protein